MESGNLKNITMQYLTIRWFTISHFDKSQFKLFHSLEKALKTAATKNINLCWCIQSENFLRNEFKKITSKMNKMHLTKLKKFDNNLQHFLSQNRINNNLFLNNIDFLQKCDEIIYHRTHADKNTSDIITSLP